MAMNACKLGTGCKKALSELPNVLITCDTCKFSWHHYTCREPPVRDVVAEAYLKTNLWRCTKCERRRGPLAINMEQNPPTPAPAQPASTRAKAETPVASSRPQVAPGGVISIDDKEENSVWNLREQSIASASTSSEVTLVEDDDDDDDIEIVEVQPPPTNKGKGPSTQSSSSQPATSLQNTTSKAPTPYKDNAFNLDKILAVLPKARAPTTAPRNTAQEPNLLYGWVSGSPLRKKPTASPRKGGRSKVQAKFLQDLMLQGSTERYTEGTCIGDTLRWEHH